MDGTINFAGVQMGHPLMNAAGTCKRLREVEILARSATAAVMVGSITLEAREGNKGNVYHATDMYSLNSLGLPNPGQEYYRQHLPTMARMAHDQGKPLFVSVAGYSPAEYMQLTALAFECGADIVELNLACPNVWVGDKQKPIPSFVPELVEDILRMVAMVAASRAISVKLSPFSNPRDIEELAEVLNESSVVTAITTTNTFPNAFDLDEDRKPRISTGYAGLAGPWMKSLGLGQVRQWSDKLSGKQIAGVGGVGSGRDVRDYLDCGATIVQVGTAYIQRQEAIFSKILSEYVMLAD